MSLFAATRVLLFSVLGRLLKSSAHVPHHLAVPLAEAAKYRGICYNKRSQAFEARLQVRGGPGYLGQFKSAKQAAEAYDQEVRRMYPDDTPDHKFRRKNWLNFPSEEEAVYHETPEEARKRAMKTFGSNHRKEARSFELLKEALEASVYSEKYELVRLTGSSKADALLKLRGSSQAGLPIQIKAATSQWKQGRIYIFNGLLGYEGMLVVLVALDGGHFWAAAGEEIKSEQTGITIGCASDMARRVDNIASHLLACFRDTQKFPHTSVEVAERQCSRNNRVEAAAHRQLCNLFSCMNWSLTSPRLHQTTVDSLLEVGVGDPVVRLQEKASHFHEDMGRYRVELSKCGGSLGRLAYAEDDFDLLIACVLQQEQLQGIFLIPVSTLVQQGFAAKRPRMLPLHPPWSPPARNRTRKKYEWQRDFFLDLRTWQGSTELPAQKKMLLEHLISLAIAKTAKRCLLVESCRHEMFMYVEFTGGKASDFGKCVLLITMLRVCNSKMRNLGAVKLGISGSN